jgi:mannose-6-phosphate isomerase-like protein (cupin superfamily)
MSSFGKKRIPLIPDAIAPDGSEVRILLGLERGGMAQFELAPQQISVAVAHNTVEEIWVFVKGRGEMWRKSGATKEIIAVEAGDCITIPVGTQFQFRSLGSEPLAAIAVTMPPWPGDGEAYAVDGEWEATVQPGQGLGQPRSE